MRLGPLTLFMRTSSARSFLLAAWHWSWSLTWSWSLSFERHQVMVPKPWAAPGRRGTIPGFGAGLGQLIGFRAYRLNGGWQWSLSLLWCSLEWRRQQTMPARAA